MILKKCYVTLKTKKKERENIIVVGNGLQAHVVTSLVSLTETENKRTMVSGSSKADSGITRYHPCFSPPCSDHALVCR